MNKRTSKATGPTCLLIAVAAIAGGTACDRGLHRDEIVQFFPTYGRFDASSNTWDCDVRGWVFKHGNRSRAAALVAGEILSIDKPAADRTRTAQRVKTFFVDRQRDKNIVAQVGSAVAKPPPSDSYGFFAGTASLAASAVAASPADPFTGVRSIACSAVTAPADKRKFKGDIFLIPPTGLSVISDIDDTIRAFPGRSFNRKVVNAFRREFEPITGMAELYQHWRESRGAVFHYVSNSAWQFTPWLEKFLETYKFPAGSLHLRGYRIAFPFNLQTWGPSKADLIERILREFPQRRFMLVGDTSEQDPEIYGEIARRYPAQIERILLRNTTDEQRGTPRMMRAMQGLPASHWAIFTAPAEVR